MHLLHSSYRAEFFKDFATKNNTFSFHQFASNVQAGKMSLAVGRYSEIHLNRSKGLGIKGFRPDVIGLLKTD